MTTSGGWSAQAPAPGPAAAAAPPGAPTAVAAAPPHLGAVQGSGESHTYAPAPSPADRAALSRLGSSDVPSGLTRWQALLTVAVLIWALLTAALLANSAQKTLQGAANTEQLTRIHAITSSLFQADAIATNAFLVGGLEPAEQRMDYDAALEQVSLLIIEAADAQPADRAALVALNTHVLHYAEKMQQARANNRQGLPVGAQYLREASSELRGETADVLEALIEANQERADRSLSGHRWPLVALPGIALLLLLGWFNQDLARVFRRRINLGLAAGAGVVALATIGATVVVWSLASSASELREESFAEVTSIAAARTAANDAKSNESLRLISRGSGAQYEENWQEASATVEENIAGNSGLTTLWEDYVTGKTEILEVEQGGDWDEAVRLAVSTEPGSATESFVAFDTAASTHISMASKAVSSTLRGGTWTAVIAAIVTALAAAAALAGVSWGLTARRKEFA